jgi:hypothetical protein
MLFLALLCVPISASTITHEPTSDAIPYLLPYTSIKKFGTLALFVYIHPPGFLDSPACLEACIFSHLVH